MDALSSFSVCPITHHSQPIKSQRSDNKLTHPMDAVERDTWIFKSDKVL